MPIENHCICDNCGKRVVLNFCCYRPDGWRDIWVQDSGEQRTIHSVLLCDTCGASDKDVLRTIGVILLREG
jgi:hypothetical protein